MWKAVYQFKGYETSSVKSNLKALGADFLPFLGPSDAGSWLPHSLTDEGYHSSWNTRLIIWGPDKTGYACVRDTEKT